MKKTIALLTALALLLCLTACGGAAAPEAPTGTTPDTTVSGTTESVSPTTETVPDTTETGSAAPVILAAEAPLNGMTAAITLTLDFDAGTALLAEVATGYGMEFKLLGETEADITPGYGMAVGQGVITANDDGTWLVSFLENTLNLTVRQAEGGYSASLSPMAGLGLLDCPVLTAAGEGEALTVTGTVNAMDIVVTLTPDLDAGTATLTEVANAYGMEFKLLGETEKDISAGYGMPVGKGAITANDDGSYAISFLDGMLVFTLVRGEDGSLSASTAPLAALGLIDTVSAVSQ